MNDTLRILMVDDNAGDIELLSLACEEVGFNVALHSARDGIEGRNELMVKTTGEAPGWRLLVLDLNMPRMDGRQLLAWVRQQPHLSALPVLVMTSSDAPRDRDECLRLGADEFRIKPTTFDQYIALARHLREDLLASGN